MGKREENKARKRRALLDAATSAFLNGGYHRTSIEQIVSDAGVARGTFYLYFKDKLSIYQDVVNQMMVPVFEALDTSYRALKGAETETQTQEIYEALAYKLTEIVFANHGASMLYYREQRDPGPNGDWLRTQQYRIDEQVIDIVSDLMGRGLLRKANSRIISVAIIGAIDRLAYAFLTGRDLGDLEATGFEVIRLFGQGLTDFDTLELPPKK